MLRGRSNEQLARLACAFAGFAWGVFWLPLRGLDEAGLEGAWATVFFFALPLLICAPLFIWRWRKLLRGGWRLQLIGATAGLAMVFYSDAVLYTEVIRGMLLFYLTPVWGTLLARIFLKEAITPARAAAILLGLAGMLVIFGVDLGVPWPRNAGDWMGLASGVVWAIAAVLMRGAPGTGAWEFGLSYFAWGVPAALLVVALPFAGAPPPPAMEDMIAVLPWVLPVILFLILPATLAALWGTQYLNPGVAGILFMTEISVGTITAAIWAGEPFGLREMLGVLLITLAGLTEIVALPMARLVTRNAAKR